MGESVQKSMIIMLLDESSSMMGLRNAVIESVNKFITEQRALPDPADIGIAAFSTSIPDMVRWIRPVGPLSKAEYLASDDYAPNGGTPLLDATGNLIMQCDELWKVCQPDRAIFGTFTDGEENSSHKYTKKKIKELIEAREKSGLWNFLFLGANIDSFDEAGSVGYNATKVANYVNTKQGYESAANTVSSTIGSLRGMSRHAFAASASGALDIGLNCNIAEDGSKTAAGGASVTTTLGQAAAPPPDSSVKSSGAAGVAVPLGVPPAAAMTQTGWETQKSSALLDPTINTWVPPQS